MKGALAKRFECKRHKTHRPFLGRDPPRLDAGHRLQLGKEPHASGYYSHPTVLGAYRQARSPSYMARTAVWSLHRPRILAQTGSPRMKTSSYGSAFTAGSIRYFAPMPRTSSTWTNGTKATGAAHGAERYSQSHCLNSSSNRTRSLSNEIVSIGNLNCFLPRSAISLLNTD
jgi:hypothetical protein